MMLKVFLVVAVCLVAVQSAAIDDGLEQLRQASSVGKVIADVKDVLYGDSLVNKARAARSVSSNGLMMNALSGAMRSGNSSDIWKAIARHIGFYTNISIMDIVSLFDGSSWDPSPSPIDD